MWFKKLPIITFVGLLLIFLNASLVQSEWQIERIDTLSQFSGITDRSIAVTDAGVVHIAYGYDHLYHAYYDGTWHIETVDSSPNVGEFASIAVDSQDRVHISYCEDYPSYDLKYITNATGSWLAETLDSSAVWYTSIAVDSHDKVHISYYDHNKNDFKYITNATGSWVAETLDSEGYVYYMHPSIAVDSQDKIHISYHDYMNSALKYITNATGSWVPETLVSTGVGRNSSIALDSQDKIHISYKRSSYPYPPDLKYITNVTGPWVAVTLDSPIAGWYSSIALDSQDKIHISYQDHIFHGYQDDDDLKYAWCDVDCGDTTNWNIETVDYIGDVGKNTSIAVDSQDKVHISYYDGANDDLKYARKCFEMDADCDNTPDNEDNCLNDYNPLQEDTYPPQGNGIGDACDCECDFDCSGSVDATDVTAFLVDFGRSEFNNPCTNGNPCSGDVDCSGGVDANDVTNFLEDFGRSQFNNPCPPCLAGSWCGGGNICQSNDDCSFFYTFCSKPTGQCDGEGICNPIPISCPFMPDPVCGCDGNTYINSCDARWWRQSIDYWGACVE